MCKILKKNYSILLFYAKDVLQFETHLWQAFVLTAGLNTKNRVLDK